MFLGIDPGASGAMGLIDLAGGLKEVQDMPIYKVAMKTKTKKGNPKMRSAWDAKKLLGMLTNWRPYVHMAAVEEIHPFPKNGAVASFWYGYGFGSLECALQNANIPYVLVAPGTWKRFMRLGKGKGCSLSMARRMFPGADLSLRKHDGRAEALLLAEYCRQHFSENHR